MKLFFFEAVCMAKRQMVISIEKTTSKEEFNIDKLSVLTGSIFASIFSATYDIPATIMYFGFVRSRKDNKVIKEFAILERIKFKWPEEKNNTWTAICQNYSQRASEHKTDCVWFLQKYKETSYIQHSDILILICLNIHVLLHPILYKYNAGQNGKFLRRKSNSIKRDL